MEPLDEEEIPQCKVCFLSPREKGKRVTAAAPSESGQLCKLGTHFYTVTVYRLNQYKETDSHYLGQRQAELQQHIIPSNKAWDPPKSGQLRSTALKAQELEAPHASLGSRGIGGVQLQPHAEQRCRASRDPAQHTPE